MKLPELNRGLMRWDKFQRFHWGYHHGVRISDGYTIPPWIIFESGEVIYTRADPRPDDRGDFAGLNVTVTTSADPKCPALCTVDGTTVPRAWLNEGGQTHLLVDHDTGRVVTLGHNIPAVPAQLRRHAKAYFAGPGEPPVGADKITLSIPHRQALTKAEWKHIEGLESAVKIRAEMTGQKPEVERVGSSHPGPVKGAYKEGPVAPDRLVKCGDLTELTNAEIYRLYHKGIGRAVRTEPYLLVKKGN